MRNIPKIKLLCLFLLGIYTTTAQDQNNRFKLSIGKNAVDAFPTNAVNSFETGALFEDFFNIKDHWNYVAAPNFISGSMYLNKGFSVGLRAGFNKITKIGKTETDKDYYSLDGVVQYAFLQDRKFDPYIMAGVGEYWMKGHSSFTANGGLGFNYWFTDIIGITFESTYKHTQATDGISHFQHSFGISIRGGRSDKDKDGVYDNEDVCPETPGLAEFNGCPDSDADGIEDKQDNCPNKPGTVANGGCPDADGDGIVDADDECPELAGTIENNGCPETDTDGDGIVDADDECPELAGTTENNGCPTVEKQLETYSKTILFVLEKTEFLEESYPALDHIFNIVQEYPEAKFIVSGHADSSGTEQFNQTLSEERAKTVVNYLVEKGIDANRFTTFGFGESKPAVPNTDEAGRKLNRRVEVVLDKE